MKVSSFLPFSVYFLGLITLFLTSFFIANTGDIKLISEWAESRSLIGLMSVICLVGLDQTLVRSPQSSWLLLKLLGLQVILLSLALGFVIEILLDGTDWWIISGFAAGASGCTVFFQYYRSNSYPLISQISQQMWKVITFSTVCMIIIFDKDISLKPAIVIILIASTLIMATSVVILRPSKLRQQNPEPVSYLYSIGIRYMITALLAALAIYAEQLIVNYAGTTEQAAKYFTYTLYFLLTSTIINGYVAFLIVPWIRDNRLCFLEYLQLSPVHILFYILFYCAALQIFGLLGWYIFMPILGPFDYLLQMLMFAMTIMRTAYLLPSGFFGAFGKPGDHSLLIALQIGALSISVCLFFTIYIMGLSIIYSVALASLCNWVLRISAGYYMVFQISKATVPYE